jgi:hypothetical protein
VIVTLRPITSRERNILVTLGLLLLVGVAYLASRQAFPELWPWFYRWRLQCARPALAPGSPRTEAKMTTPLKEALNALTDALAKRPAEEILFQWFRSGRLISELSDLIKRRHPAVQAEIDRVYQEHLAKRGKKSDVGAGTRDDERHYQSTLGPLSSADSSQGYYKPRLWSPPALAGFRMRGTERENQSTPDNSNSETDVNV